MSTKQVAGTSLFSDLEGFMTDLSEQELELVGGGGKKSGKKYKGSTKKKSGGNRGSGSRSGFGGNFICFPVYKPVFCPPPRPKCYW